MRLHVAAFQLAEAACFRQFNRREARTKGRSRSSRDRTIAKAERRSRAETREGGTGDRHSGKSLCTLAGVCRRECGPAGSAAVEQAITDLSAVLGERGACLQLGMQRGTFQRRRTRRNVQAAVTLMEARVAADSAGAADTNSDRIMSRQSATVSCQTIGNGAASERARAGCCATSSLARCGSSNTLRRSQRPVHLRDLA